MITPKMKNKKKIKIGFFINALHTTGGAERVMTILANKLIENYEVIIFTQSRGDSYYKLNESVKQIHLIEEINPSLNTGESFKTNLKIIKNLKLQTANTNIDILISFMTKANIIAVICGLLNNIPVLISERNNPLKQKINPFWNILRFLIYPFAKKIIVQTKDIKEYFHGKVPRKNLKILPNPISPEFASTTQKVIEKDNIILNVGSLTEQKSQETLLKAFYLAAPINWKLLIAGEGHLKTKLLNLSQELGIEEKVIFLGKTKEIASIYSKSKIFAFSSVYEGFPNALIEAMYFGLACVSTNCPTGPSELIEDGVNGFLVPMNDEEKLAQKLRELVNSKEMRVDFGKKAKLAVQTYSANQVVLEWEGLINEVLER